MKTFKIYAAAVIATASLALTSCEDWLTIYPQNKLTDEQFWEDMNDLQAVRYAAYRNFAQSGVVDKILTWGELRSDNVYFSGMSNATHYSDMLRITDGRLDTASNFNDWGTFYTTINYCNQVLNNGELVLERDPQFSNTEWRRIKAEMIALRALNYFYLVRAFGNVPYVNTVIKTDAQVQRHTQAYQSDILDSLINDVESIKDDARLYFAPKSGSYAESRSLITKPFCYALLADLYLWRGAKYEGAWVRQTELEKDAKAKKEEFDPSVLKSAKRNAAEMYWKAYQTAVQARELIDNQTNGQYVGLYVTDRRSRAHMGKYYLNQSFVENTSSEIPQFLAWQSLFSEGASDETIFEMPFLSSDDQSNGSVNKFFGIVTNSSGIPFYSNYDGLKYCAPYSLEQEAYYDLRLVYTCAYTNSTIFPNLSGGNTAYSANNHGYMMKYRPYDELRYQLVDGKPNYRITFENNDYAPFIIYRKSDLLFIEGEAICLLKQLGDAYKDDVNLEDVKLIVAEHRRRSFYKYVQFSEDATGQYMTSGENSKFNNAGDALKILLDEKQLEFVGEGKRWFDIVRYMERMGATNDAINEMFGGSNTGEMAGSMYKHNDRAQRYKSNLRARWAFYNAVYYPEREASAYMLYQNPYWDDDPINNNDMEPAVRENDPDNALFDFDAENPSEETGEEGGNTEE